MPHTNLFAGLDLTTTAGRMTAAARLAGRPGISLQEAMAAVARREPPAAAVFVPDGPAREYRLPGAFYHHHVAQDLLAGGLVREAGRQVVVLLDGAAWDELRSDAAFYSDGGPAADMRMPGLARSAAATVRALDRQGRPA